MKVIVDGLAIEYRDEGNGPVVLMLHGWKDTLHTFDPLVPALAENHRVIRVDLPGFGGSEMPKDAWGVPEYAAFVAAFMRKANVSAHAVIGHSFGGRLTLWGIGQGVFAAQKIVLIASAGVAERKTVKNASLRALAKVAKIAALPLPKRMRDQLRQRLYAGIKSDYAQTGRLRETFVKTIALDLSAEAAKIEIPTLLIWGSADPQTPLSEGVRLSKLIKGSTFSLIEAAGHFVHREHPDKVAASIAAFI
ncbi:MAG: alpha/beta hydrolase [Candidatus Paceibacterota bacterium]